MLIINRDVNDKESQLEITNTETNRSITVQND